MENLIIIHGAIGASDQMLPIGNLLKKHFNVHYLELDGHGKKSSSDFEFGMPHFTGQLEAIIREVPGSSAHVFGYSMGGFVALMLAISEQKMIKSIFTLGTKLLWNKEIASRECRMLDPEKIEEKVPDFAKILAARHGDNQWKTVLKRTSELLMTLGRDQPTDEFSMHQVKCPVKLCLGDLDEMVTIEETEKVVGWLPQGKFEILENSKHPIEKVDISGLSQKIVNFTSSLT